MNTANFIFIVGSSFILCFLMSKSRAHDTISSPSPQVPPSTNGTGICCGWYRKGEYHHRRGNWNRNRVIRSAPGTPPNMEDKLKEFAAKLGKTPDELRAAFGKFMLAHGISLQQMQETLEQGNQMVLQEIENIKKAMHI